MVVRAVILAAGQGTRMRSDLPKVLHPILGKPMLEYAIDAVQQEAAARPVIIVGHSASQIRQAIGGRADFAVQELQLGTAHALQMAEPLLRGKTDLILVTYGDMPLLTPGTIHKIVEAQSDHPQGITMLTLVGGEPRGFGRVIRGNDGEVVAIIEEADATPEQLAVRELNPGVYCFPSSWLWAALKRISVSPKGEYYLTDLIGIAVAEGLRVQALPADDPAEGIGVNTLQHLAEAEAVLRERIIRSWMLSGVTIKDPSRTYIEADVRIGTDSVIWPGSYLLKGTQIGAHCTIGPDAFITESQVGDRCRVFASVLESAQVEEDVEIGPFSHLRSGAHLAAGAHLGNFGEVKNSYLGPGTKMGHFSYIGDAQIGSDVNIGAGTVTCNFDGEKKNATEIGSGVFIGSDTMLVAPVKIGEGARTGAGSVVTKDIPPDTLAVGVPARSIRKLKKSP